MDVVSPVGRTSAVSTRATGGGAHKPLYRHLYIQVLIGIALGVLLGLVAPRLAVQMKPLGDAFIKLIQMLIAPIVFATVVVGVARMGDMKEVGRIGLKTIAYFEIVTTLALAIGLIVVNLLQPGSGMNVDPNALDTSGIQTYTTSAQHLSAVDTVLNIIPQTALGAFTNGDILQVLLFSILFGAALAHLGERGRQMIGLIDELGHVLFGMVRMIMYLAPIGAFGAIAFTVGTYGPGTLLSLGKLVGGVWLTSVLFVVVILGVVSHLAGFSLWKFLRYMKEEIFLIMGTTSAEIAMPRVMAKLENLGCRRTVVGLVVPTGYSFNLAGSAVYLTMAAIFIAQATNTPMSLISQIELMAVLMLTSKGAASVAGAGFVTLAATLASTGALPVAGLALLLGVDRFMSESRAVTNLIGNAVAGLVVARWEHAVDVDRMQRVLNEETDEDAERPEDELVDNDSLEATPVLVGAGQQQRMESYR